ncbi:glycoside hydrolase family 10 protein [Diplodia corticola]|uniref:Beta-xylanase n=1 Tax=Diplodia corticola TaxID=236234 RepID=A0A1J9RRF4_9PEZI|nr:glycoside hydrolase family 10 protein [Diplodia corticola]OJD35115.1 glycoside hydrolase family 10 protein [Diplodia corticola]
MSFVATAFTSLLAVQAAQAIPFSRRAAAGLNTAAQAAGLEYFGSATDNPELTDTDYVAGLNNTADFGQITPGNSMKWDTIEPSRDSFSYTKGDVIADLAEANGQKLRCHTLVWYNQLPNWVKTGGFDNATLVEILKNHVTNEVTHYKGRCDHWDVVNEALDDDGNHRDFVFYNTIGEAYIPIAFAAAAAADPDAKLFYNDYSIEWSGNKQKAAKKIVELVQSYGVKIDGVGLQAHFTVGNTVGQDALETTIQDFASLGVEVAITELDIRMETPATDANLEQQATDYASIVNGCLNQKDACRGITIWDYTDKYSWVPSTFSGYGAALPWDENLEKKPAYDSILSALQAAAGTNGTSTSTPAVETTPAAATPTPTATKASSSAVVAPSATSVEVAETTAAGTPVETPAQTPIGTAAETPSSTPAASTGSSGSAVSKYGQCGGTSYSGATTCESGSTCKEWNQYYSQCI